MPKAFLLTNKRYKIWEQIKETFKQQKLLEQLDRRHKYAVDDGLSHYKAADDSAALTSTDYSKYTDYTDDEGNH